MKPRRRMNPRLGWVCASWFWQLLPSLLDFSNWCGVGLILIVIYASLSTQHQWGKGNQADLYVLFTTLLGLIPSYLMRLVQCRRHNKCDKGHVRVGLANGLSIEWGRGEHWVIMTLRETRVFWFIKKKKFKQYKRRHVLGRWHLVGGHNGLFGEHSPWMPPSWCRTWGDLFSLHKDSTLSKWERISLDRALREKCIVGKMK